MTTVIIPAVPVAQPRHRATGGVLYLPTDNPVHAFKACCALAWREANPGPPLEGPIHIDVVFVLPRLAGEPKKRPGRRLHPKKPDIDNLLKSLCDALNRLAWRDDNQIASVHAVKYYAGTDEQPHVDLTVERMGNRIWKATPGDDDAKRAALAAAGLSEEVSIQGDAK